jgi:amino acid adenylation domain-containing protein/non-ribosomal peptide synthase protein (TIGR01720 family)
MAEHSPDRTEPRVALPRLAVHELFDRWVGLEPEAVAIDCAGRLTTYSELAAAAARLAAQLPERPGTAQRPADGFVALWATDVSVLVTGILACLRSGLGFVPLDVRTPRARLAEMLEDVAPLAIVVEEALESELLAALPVGLEVRLLRQPPVLSVATDERVAVAAGERPAVPVDPDARCYVYFTSGSTGKPKGIVGRLKGIDHFIRWEVDTLKLDPGLRVSQLTAPSFDAFLRDVFVPLAVGGTLCVPARRGVVGDGGELVAFLEQAEVELVHCVPTVFRTLLTEGLTSDRLPKLRWVLLAGERLLPADLERWYSVFGERVRLVNLYGPSETTMTKFAHFLAPGDAALRSIPIGRPIRGAEAILLDSQGRPAPPRAIGEIAIRTPFRSHGYLGRPDLDELAFVPNPITGDSNDRVYRTGDFGRQLADGSYEFLGRRDSQVKVRGVRVEIAEVEDALRRYPGIDDLVVVDREDQTGSTSLCAFFTGSEPIDPESLRRYAEERLPMAAVPTHLIRLDQLPRTLSGKVDRKALPAVAELLALRRSPRTPPRTPLAQAVAGLWSEVLGVEGVGLEDVFFDLGGQSLLATRMLTRLRATLGVEVSLAELFTRPSLAGLVERVEELSASERPRQLPPLVRRTSDIEPPLSFAQERLWFLQQLEPESPAYNMAVAVRLLGALDAERLRAALERVVHRHEALRTRFPVRDGRPVQEVVPPEPLTWTVIEAPGDAAAAKRAATSAARGAFDLGVAPPVRFDLCRVSDSEHLLVVVVHHIVSDLASMEILTREVRELLEASAADRTPCLPELTIQPADLAATERAWLAGEVLGRELAFWRARLEGGLEPLTLPTDRPRPAHRAGRGGILSFRLGADLQTRLRGFVRREGVTSFMALLGAFQTLLGRYADQPAVSVGSPFSGRERPETEGLIGFFVHTLVLRTPLAGRPSFRQLLRRSRETVLEAFAHRSVPLEVLMDELRPGRELAYTPLFQVWFTLQEPTTESLEAAGVEMRLEGLELGTSRFDLALFLADRPDGTQGTLEFDADLFDAATLERWMAHLGNLLEGGLERPDAALADLVLLTPAERAELLAPAVLDPRTSSPGLCLHELFELQVERSPTATAVACGDERLTYAELDERANRLAHRLLRAGAGPERLVGLAAERSIALVTGLLAILKTGSAYLPLDPSYPEARLRHMLADSGVRWVLVDEAGDRALEGIDLAGCLDLEADDLAEESSATPERRVRGLEESLAYVIYTSGSTGLPKGVAVSHRNVTRLFAGTADWYGFDETDVWSLFHSYAFDVSVWELWGAFLHGGTLVVVPFLVSRSPEQFYRLLVEARVTVLSATTSAFRQVVAADEEATPELRERLALRWVVFGGEAVDLTAVGRWWRRHPELEPRLINMYGITETTVHSTFRCLHQADLELPNRSPIGVPIRDLEVFLLDRGLLPVPYGVPGELFVGGSGVARGYLNRRALTAQRFVPDPVGARPGGRLYRSGDLARWLPGGELDYLGRLDHQVKIRGFRVELGEIEAALALHPGVAEALVLADAGPGEESVRLVAFVIPFEGREPQPHDLRALTGARLPEYMLPSALVVLERLPMTSNGKVDRRALLGLARQARATPRGAAPPRTLTEQILAQLWQEVLGLERVSRDDDFFALGGHSLIATRLMSRVRSAFGVEVPLLALFEEPDLASLALTIERMRGGEGGAPSAPSLSRGDSGALQPLSFGQQRLWFLYQLDPTSAAYHLPISARLDGPLEVASLTAALRGVVDRHEVLRTAFVTVLGQPRPSLASRVPMSWPVIDLSGLAGPIALELERQLFTELARRPFDLERAPLVRPLLLRVGRDRHLACLVLHHIVTDEWSHAVLVRELGACYAAARQGEVAALAELPLQYADFARWQRGWLESPEAEPLFAYWREQLAGTPALDLPLDRPRPALPRFLGGQLPVRWGPEVGGRLERLCRQAGVTPFMVVTALLRWLLRLAADQRDFALGTPIANRRSIEVEGLIGFFVNTLALRLDLAGVSHLLQLLQREREMALAAFQHQDAPFERVVDQLGLERDLQRSPVFQAMVVFHNAPPPVLALPGLEAAAVGLDTGTAKFELTLFAGWHEGSLAGHVEFDRDLFDRATIERLAQRFARLAERALLEPERDLRSLDLLSDAEHLELSRWSWGEADRAGGAMSVPLLVERFEGWARATPDATAVEAEGRTTSYADLNRAANRLARRLLGHDLPPESLVGLALPRGVELVGALLAVLKAGLAYLPLDPAAPAARSAGLLEQAGCRLVLGSLELPASLAGSVELWPDLAAGSDLEEGLDSPVALVAEQLAYVLFTSGSTGRPKGVMVPHGGLAAYLDWVATRYGLSPERGAPVHSPLGFDLTVTSLLGPLVVGSRVVLAEDDEAAEGLSRLLENRGGFDLLKLTPAHLDLLATRLPARRLEAAADRLVIGGEALRFEKLERWRREAPQTVLVNEYGPTEAVVGCTVYVVRPEDPAAGSVPIGRPVSYTEVEVVSSGIQRAPAGWPGELWVGGPALARGYLGRPAMTAAAFVPRPWGGESGERMYRTGDRVRYRPDGNLEFLGRLDQQVKLRGFRIEPSEIETALRQLDGVEDAHVRLGRDRLGREALVAYWVGAERSLTSAQLRAELGSLLPSYLVPSVFLWLEALPLTPNGKLDGSRLPPVSSEAEVEHLAFQAPRDAREEALAGIWQRVLNLETVSVLDNFFEVGGDSILAIEIVAQAAQAGLRLTPRQMFQFQTVAELARAATVLEPSAELENEPAIDGPVPLGPIQRWFFEQKRRHPEHYNQSVALDLERGLPVRVWEEATTALLSSHDALRSRFLHGPEGWRQEVLPVVGGASGCVRYVDLRGLEEVERAVAALAACEEAQASFDLAAGPLLRLLVLDLDRDERQRVVVIVHHLAVDAVSWEILLSDLEAASRSLADGQEPVAPRRSASYRTWVETLEQEAREREPELGHWLALEGIRTPRLPRPGAEASSSGREGDVVTRWVELDEARTTRLLQVGLASLRCRIDEVLLAAVARALSLATGASGHVVDVEGHGRTATRAPLDLGRTIGWFTELHPLLLPRLEPEQPLEAWARQTKERVRRLPDRGQGFAALRYLHPDSQVRSRLARLPAREVSFNYLGQIGRSLEHAALWRGSAAPRGLERHREDLRSHLLTVDGAILAGRLGLGVGFAPSELDPSLIERFVVELEDGLTRLANVAEPAGLDYSPTDFPDVQLSQDQLDSLLRELGEG